MVNLSGLLKSSITLYEAAGGSAACSAIGRNSLVIFDISIAIVQ